MSWPLFSSSRVIQISQQRFVRANRSIDTARPVKLVRSHNLLIQRLAHAVQALEFVLAKLEITTRHAVYSGGCIGVMRGELRKNLRRSGQKLAGASQIANIGMCLSGEHRKPLKPIHLRPLDLAVPIRTLHQAYHQPAVRPAREVNQKVDHERRTLLIGLNHKAHPIPPAKPLVEAERFQQVEREFQAIRDGRGRAMFLISFSVLLWLLEKVAATVERFDERQIGALTVVLGGVLGVLVSISSVGAGAIGVTALLMLYPKLPIVRIVGSDIAHAVPLTLIAGAGHWWIGSVDWSLLASLLVGSIPGIAISSYFASRVPDKVLRPLLAGTLAVVGGRLVF